MACTGCVSASNEHSSVVDSASSNALSVKHEAKTEKVDSKAVKSAFAPTYQSDEDDKYHDAIEIYESSPSAPQGIYHWQGLVYVIVTIDTQRESIPYLEGTAMLRVKALLQKEFPSLPTEFNIRNRLVEKGLDDDAGIYRYAVAFRLSDIRKLIEEKNKNK